MPNQFHKYVELSSRHSSEESLDELEKLLMEDQKKSIHQREINSTKYSDNGWSFNEHKMTPLQFALRKTAYDNTPRLKK